MSFEDRLRSTRLSKKLTQGEVAIGIAVHPSVISAWECGSYAPRPDALERLAKFLEVNVDYLLHGAADAGAATNGSTKSLTVPEILADAKAKIAGVLGVPAAQVKLDMSLTA